jgi:molecular chaperone DnaK
MDRPLYLGIDLGTTNSAASVFDGEQLLAIRTQGGETLTPSVVRIDAKGGVSVGARARRFLQRDPNNTRAEFKRLMGSQNRCEFEASGSSRSPEELSAEVLRSLRKDVEAQLGFSPEHAVIAVPALFELPQIRATSEAARLAGFNRVETIQEPVASALASGWTAEESRGHWLVYDLGGGTFDASLLETQEGLLRVVGHDGDNFLGGRDFDLALVDWLLERLAAQSVHIDRGNVAHAGAVATLKAHAEEVKIELSRADSTSLVVDDLELDGETCDELELVVTAKELADVTARLVDRSIAVCHRLLKQHGVRKLERVVLVGGPTLMPSLRQRLELALQAPFGIGLDPMLLVAQGAALFAVTAGLDARPQRPGGAAAKGPKLWLQYPAMTPDMSPFVVGRSLTSEGEPALEAVRFVRGDGDWASEWLTLEADGTFSGMLSLQRRQAGVFAVEAREKGGRVVRANPAEISLMHGVAIGEPPLARTIGVALADDSVQVYFERGSPLPMRKTFTLRTVQAVAPSADCALRVPIVQGDFPFAHLCRLVGVIEIPAQALKQSLPIGSVIELTLEVDRGGALSVKALIPVQELVFDRVEQLVAPAASPEQMTELLRQLQQRAAELRAAGFRNGERAAITALAEFDAALADIHKDISAARGGSADAAEKARRGVIDADGLLGDLEAQNAWPELNARVYEEHTTAVSWLESLGTETEKKALVHCMDQIQRSLRGRNLREIERHLNTVSRLRLVAYLRHPEVWSWELDGCANRLQEASDPRQAQTLLNKGRKAEAAGNRAEVERAVRDLWRLLPTNSASRALGFDSGVR